jgi:hypothetical protein
MSEILNLESNPITESIRRPDMVVIPPEHMPDWMFAWRNAHENKIPWFLHDGNLLIIDDYNKPPLIYRNITITGSEPPYRFTFENEDARANEL